LLLLAFYVILQAFLKQKWWLYFWSLPLVYLAVYMKQNNLILLAPLGFAVSLSLWREFQQRPAAEVLKYVGLTGVATAFIFAASWFSWEFNLIAYAQRIFNRIFFHGFAFGGYQFGYSGNDTHSSFTVLRLAVISLDTAATTRTYGFSSSFLRIPAPVGALSPCWPFPVSFWRCN
jgi:hypothetical protein